MMIIREGSIGGHQKVNDTEIEARKSAASIQASLVGIDYVRGVTKLKLIKRFHNREA